MGLNHKSQSALEYMMTYGWAILVIVIVAGVLYSLGIFSPASSLSSTVTGFSNLGSVTGECTANGILRISLGDSTGYPINITGVTAKSSTGQISTFKPNSTVDPSPIIQPTSNYIFSVPNVCPPAGSRYSLAVMVNYTEPGQIFPGPYTSTGTVAGTTTSTVLPQFVASFNGFKYFSWSYIQFAKSWTYFPESYINASVGSVVGTNNSFTVIMWLYPLTPDYVTVPPPNDTSGYTSNQLAIASFNTDQSIASSGPGDIFMHRCSAADTYIYSAGSILPNQWDFIAVSVNKPDYYININGEAGSTSNTAGYTTGGDFIVGSNFYCFGGWPFYGYISNVQVYNSSLSPTQLEAAYNAGLYSSPVIKNNSLVGWWSLNGTLNNLYGTSSSFSEHNASITSNYK
ncbi:LamG domain-containing protein [Candidatus Parvarchaeota archaeon]|nr:LamG domain-containing protein [Candidatus Parvarchaeota archaeon]